MTWAPVSARPFVSQHLGERHLAELRVNPEAQATYASLVPESSFAVGTVILETLRSEKTGAAGPVLALERTENDWRYWQLGPAGNLEHADAALACAGCHAAAPAAPLFGPPREAVPEPMTAVPATERAPAGGAASPAATTTLPVTPSR
jgi:hypothetical protein